MGWFGIRGCCGAPAVECRLGSIDSSKKVWYLLTCIQFQHISQILGSLHHLNLPDGLVWNKRLLWCTCLWLMTHTYTYTYNYKPSWPCWEQVHQNILSVEARKKIHFFVAEYMIPTSRSLLKDSLWLIKKTIVSWSMNCERIRLWWSAS